MSESEELPRSPKDAKKKRRYKQQGTEQWQCEKVHWCCNIQEHVSEQQAAKMASCEGCQKRPAFFSLHVLQQEVVV